MLRILTDSTSDIPNELAKQLNIEIFHLEVRFSETEVYRDGVDLSAEEFYRKLPQYAQLPSTSQISPAEFKSYFKEIKENGDEAVGIFISSELSGTCQSAAIAKQMLDADNIYVVDSRTVTFSLGLLVLQAVKLRDQGCSAKEICEKIEEMKQHLRLYAMVDTLKYLKKGGRISAVTAVAGEALGIKPIISTIGGRVELVGKSRGRAGAFDWIVRQMEKDLPQENSPTAFGHSDAPEFMEEFLQLFPDAMKENAMFGPLGCAVGTYAGPGAVGIAYFQKEKLEV